VYPDFSKGFFPPSNIAICSAGIITRIHGGSSAGGGKAQKEEKLLLLYHLSRFVCSVLCSRPWRSEYKKEDYNLEAK